MKKESFWQGIEMLPVIDEMVIENINDAHAQLSFLASKNQVKETLSNDQLQQLINTYEEKSNQAHLLKEQCRLWRNTQHLSDQQKLLLSSLELNLVRSEKVSQQILVEIHKQLTDKL